MSTASHLCRTEGFLFVLRRKFCVLSPQRRSKRPEPAGKTDFFKITDHLKPPTVAKRCTFLESRKSPALRGFVAGRWALATTSLYPSTKIERPQRAQNRAPWRCSFSEFGWPGQPPPHARPNTAEIPFQGHHLHTVAKPAHGADTAVTGVLACSTLPCLRTPDALGKSRCGSRPQMRQASAYPPKG